MRVAGCAMLVGSSVGTWGGVREVRHPDGKGHDRVCGARCWVGVGVVGRKGACNKCADVRREVMEKD